MKPTTLTASCSVTGSPPAPAKRYTATMRRCPTSTTSIGQSSSNHFHRTAFDLSNRKMREVSTNPTPTPRQPCCGSTVRAIHRRIGGEPQAAGHFEVARADRLAFPNRIWSDDPQNGRTKNCVGAPPYSRSRRPWSASSAPRWPNRLTDGTNPGAMPCLDGPQQIPFCTTSLDTANVDSNPAVSQRY